MSASRCKRRFIDNWVLFFATALSILFCLFLNKSFPVCGGPLICYKLAYFLSSNCIPTPWNAKCFHRSGSFINVLSSRTPWSWQTSVKRRLGWLWTTSSKLSHWTKFCNRLVSLVFSGALGNLKWCIRVWKPQQLLILWETQKLIKPTKLSFGRFLPRAWCDMTSLTGY